MEELRGVNQANLLKNCGKSTEGGGISSNDNNFYISKFPPHSNDLNMA